MIGLGEKEGKKCAIGLTGENVCTGVNANLNTNARCVTSLGMVPGIAKGLVEMLLERKRIGKLGSTRKKRKDIANNWLAN